MRWRNRQEIKTAANMTEGILWLAGGVLLYRLNSKKRGGIGMAIVAGIIAVVVVAVVVVIAATAAITAAVKDTLDDE